MLKIVPLPDIFSAVRLVHAGEVVFDLGAVGKIFYRFSRDTDKSQYLNSLQSRELEAIEPAVKDMGNKENASKLGISMPTVQTHLVSVFKKFGASSRTETLLCALREGWMRSMTCLPEMRHYNEKCSL